MKAKETENTGTAKGCSNITQQLKRLHTPKRDAVFLRVNICMVGHMKAQETGTKGLQNGVCPRSATSPRNWMKDFRPDTFYRSEVSFKALSVDSQSMSSAHDLLKNIVIFILL